MNHQNRPQPKYKFYATLLDAFHYYLKSEAENAFEEFINKINRVPFVSEAAEKGTAFNDLVDLIAAGKLPELLASGILVERVVRNKEVLTYHFTSRDGNAWSFDYPPEIVHYFAGFYSQAIPQLRVVGYLETTRGTVELYGNLDELMGDVVDDIKTTGSYDFPKYLHNYQHLVYPFALRQQGFDVTAFRYHITDFKNIYKEEYVYNEDRDMKRLVPHVEHLIDFLEMNRHLITDKKVFAEDEPSGVLV